MSLYLCLYLHLYLYPWRACAGADPLGYDIEPERCGIRVTKSRKLIVTLRKVNEKIEWDTLHPKRWL
jgi:hypothetical protein